MTALTRLVLPVVLFALGAYLLLRALRGGGLVLYFVSAVAIGMGIAALQRARRA